MQPREILVPIDFSAPSPNALQEAAAIAHQYDAELTLLHVHQIEAIAFMDFTYVESPEKVAELTELAEKELQALVDALPDPKPRYRIRVLTGRPVDEIVNLSEAYDLIVMPTHGRTGLNHFLMGSVAERVVKGARCSVLIVKPRNP